MTISRIPVAGLVAALMVGIGVLAPPAQAYEAPIFATVSAYAYGGDARFHGSGDSDADAGPSVVSATAGAPWWCSTPGCSIALGPGAGLGWSTITADPVSGEIRARAGAMNTSHNTIQWTIDVPWGSGSIQYVPGFWGETVTEAYLRRSWRLVATDPALEAGSPVSVTGSFHLTGAIETGDITRAEGGLLLNSATLANANWLAGNEAIDVHTLFELVVVDPQVTSRTFGAYEPGPVDIDESLTQIFAVGDIVVMETLLRLTAAVRNEGIPREVWVDLDDTLRSEIVVNTAGVILVPVPEPATWGMLAAGLGVLAAAMRRRRT